MDQVDREVELDVRRRQRVVPKNDRVLPSNDLAKVLDPVPIHRVPKHEDRPPPHPVEVGVSFPHVLAQLRRHALGGGRVPAVVGEVRLARREETGSAEGVALAAERQGVRGAKGNFGAVVDGILEGSFQGGRRVLEAARTRKVSVPSRRRGLVNSPQEDQG